jgi:hypothetical protein
MPRELCRPAAPADRPAARLPHGVPIPTKLVGLPHGLSWGMPPIWGCPMGYIGAPPPSPDCLRPKLIQRGSQARQFCWDRNPMGQGLQACGAPEAFFQAPTKHDVTQNMLSYIFMTLYIDIISHINKMSRKDMT